MSRNRLYLLLSFATFAGYGYLALAIARGQQDNRTTLCLVKNATGIACPSCGSTRSVLLLLKGDISGAWLLNPIGLLVAAILLILPLWLLFDVAGSKSTLHHSYLSFEKIVRIWWIAACLIVLVIINWIWNIQKGL